MKKAKTFALEKVKKAKTFASEVGSRLKAVREASNLPANVLARRLGVTPQRYNNWETGDIVLPPEIAVILFRELRIDADYLYLGDAERLPAKVRDRLRDGNGSAA